MTTPFPTWAAILGAAFIVGLSVLVTMAVLSLSRRRARKEQRGFDPTERKG